MRDKKKFTIREKIKFTLTLLFLFILVIILIGEVVLRFFSEGQKEFSDKSIINQELGWLPKANYSSSYTMQTKGANPVKWEAKYETTKNGFRTWPEIDSTKSKILLIGDSFVQAVEVSTNKAFFSHLADSLNVDVYAFGQAGYGTLQQKMILSKYKDQINPNLIILQTCDNDFIDNHGPLEYNSKYKVGLRRPYYDLQGKLEYVACAEPNVKWKRLIDKSRFLGLLRKKIEFTFFKKDEKSSQQLIAELGDEYEPYFNSQKVTSIILKEMKTIAGETPLIAFSASPYEPQLSAFKKLSHAAQIPFYDSIGVKIQQAYWHKKRVYSSDGFHWSEEGHRRVADLLLNDLIKSGITENLKNKS